MPMSGDRVERTEEVDRLRATLDRVRAEIIQLMAWHGASNTSNDELRRVLRVIDE
jgi:hypothetical protein